MRHHAHCTIATLGVVLLASALAASCSDDAPDRERDDTNPNNVIAPGIDMPPGNTCTAPRIDCSGTCVDTTSDPRHCGGCGVACAAGDLCQAGACVTPEGSCTDGTLTCDGFTYCAETTGQCLAGCATNDQCEDTETCDTAAHECVCAEGFEVCTDGSPGCCPMGPGTFSEAVAGNYTDVELLLDAQGRAIVLAVEGDDSPSLDYAAEDEEGEFRTTVGMWDVEIDGEIAAVIDDTSTIHVAYAAPAPNAASGANNSILYMTLQDTDDGIARTFEEVALTSESGPLEPDIALDPTTGEPAIAFVESGGSAGRALKIARRSAGGWTVEEVDRLSDFEEPSISFTSTGETEIAYRETRSEDLKLAIYAFGEWYIDTVVEQGDVGTCADHAFGPSDVSAMTYFNATDGSIDFTRLDGDSYFTRFIGNAGGCQESSLLFDDAGNPHLTWVDTEAGTLHYAWNDAGAFEPWQTLDLGEATGLSDLALTDDGKARIVFTRPPSGAFQVWTQR